MAKLVFASGAPSLEDLASFSAPQVRTLPSKQSLLKQPAEDNPVDEQPVDNEPVDDEPADDELVDDEPIARSLKSGNVPKKIGYYTICTLSLGTACIIGAIALISFLWWSDSTNEVWRKIIAEGWITRSVTIAALVVRMSISFHAIACTRILASLALQWHQVPLDSSAPVSVLRYANSGPFSLVGPLLKAQRHFKPFPLAGALVLVIGLVATLANVTSTVLLSDLDIKNMIGAEEPIQLYFARTSSQQQQPLPSRDNEFWNWRPTQFPTFAETRYGAGRWDVPVNISGVYDTGIILRAFLPMASEQARMEVKELSGIASLTATRTICAQPDIKLNQTNIWRPVSNYELHGTGRLDPNKFGKFPFLNASIVDEFKFKCEAPLLQEDGKDSRWRISFCHIEPPYLLSISDFIATLSFEGVQYTQYLVINVTKESEYRLGNETEWTTRKFGDIYDALFSISYCVSAYGDGHREIRASRSGSAMEPTLGWNRSTLSYDTTAVREQLGATRTDIPYENRGILKLHDIWRPDILSDLLNGQVGLGLFKYAVGADYANLHAVQQQILTDILMDTSHPALALQAHAAMIYSLAYYEEYIELDLALNGTVRRFISALRPVAARGYGAFIAISSLHLLLVLVVVLLYFRNSPDEHVLGGSWSAVAQLITEEFTWVWEFAKASTDEEVTKAFERNGLKKRYAGFIKDGDSYIVSSIDALATD